MVTLVQSMLLASGRILSPSLGDWAWAFCGLAGAGGVEGAR